MPRTAWPARAAHHVDQPDAVLLADLVQHLPRFDAAAVCTSALWPFALMSGHAERRQRLTNTQGRPPAAVVRAGSGCSRSPSAGDTAYTSAADHRHRLAQQRLRRFRGARLDHRARALVATGMAWSSRAVRRAGLPRHLRRDLDLPLPLPLIWPSPCRSGPAAGRVRRIDRRRLDLDDELIRPGLGDGDLASRQFEFTGLGNPGRSCSRWSWWRRSSSSPAVRWLAAFSTSR